MTFYIFLSVSLLGRSKGARQKRSFKLVYPFSNIGDIILTNNVKIKIQSTELERFSTDSFFSHMYHFHKGKNRNSWL